MPQPIRIAIAEDQILMRKIMADLLEMEADFQIVFEANNGLELLQYLDHGAADLILTDLEMPEMGGMDLIQTLQEQQAGLPVVVLSSDEDEATILAAIQAGAKGYMLKNALPEEVMRTLRAVMQQGYYFSDSISQLLLKGIVSRTLPKAQAAPLIRLTKREQEILELICQEKTNQEIAEALFLSPRTVESYRKNMIEKAGVRNTVGLVLFAIRQGWIRVE